jgi:hypothetical protein
MKSERGRLEQVVAEGAEDKKRRKGEKGKRGKGEGDR